MKQKINKYIDDHKFSSSLIFLIVPFVSSTALAFATIKKEEDLGGEFLEWSKGHKKIVEIFTLLAGADIEALTILESKVKIAGFDFFNAKFSPGASSKIFWGACFNIIAEDIPQIIIQVCK